MAHLIDKDALVAEIDRILGSLTDAAFDSMIGRNLQKVKDFINTLEIKEVDLDKEIDLVEDRYHGFESLSRADVIDIAKHFFEIGLKAKQV